MRSRSERFSNSVPAILGWACLVAAVAVPALGAGRPREAALLETALEPAGDAAGSGAGDSPSKKQSLWLAFLMFGGILMGGSLLLALVVTWGNRTRRLARSPLPPVARPDDLWFLKPKKSRGDSEGEPRGNSQGDCDPRREPETN